MGGTTNIKYNLSKISLKLKVRMIIINELKEKYYNQVVTPEINEQYLKTNRADVGEKINRDLMFLEASEYIKKSNEKNKYKIAYDKYKKQGINNSFKFFKSAVTNENYLNYLRKHIEKLKKETLSDGEKNTLFMQNLSNYVINSLSKHDKKIREHLSLAKIHKCNYESILYFNWFVEQGQKLAPKIYDLTYGSSIKEILSYDSGLIENNLMFAQ